MTKDADSSREMSFDDVVDILRILDGAGVPTTIDYRNGPLRVRIRRGARTEPADASKPAEAAQPAQPRAPADPAEPAADGTAVPAPIAGVFYRAPSPGADPFVEVGDVVAADTVIGIVEVMKLMNTVRCGVAGVVTEVCAENAALVEYGQPLVRVRAEGDTR